MDRGVACPAGMSLLLDEEEYRDVSDRAAGGATVFLDNGGEVEEVEENDCLDWRRWRELLPMTDGIAVFESNNQLGSIGEQIGLSSRITMSRSKMRLAYRPAIADIDHRLGDWGSDSYCLRNRALHNHTNNNIKSMQRQSKPGRPSNQTNAIKLIGRTDSTKGKEKESQ